MRQPLPKIRKPGLNLLLALLVVDVLLALLILGLNGYNRHSAPTMVVGQGIKAISQGHTGSGTPSGRGNQLALENLMPGDILLGGNRGSTYGGFTHAALYAGEGQAWQGWLTLGISKVDAVKFRDYDRACILRVAATPDQRETVLREVESHQGQLFFPLPFKSGERIWNCSKIIWLPFFKLGLDLDSFQDIWVTPDSIYRSSLVEIIAEDGEIW
ncbi:MAG: hypothetical protein GXY50_10285 [Syntrophomonadaceae bacterium]|nr:hypothetical protein [Syntrophomonadaceae bacterium]